MIRLFFIQSILFIGILYGSYITPKYTLKMSANTSSLLLGESMILHLELCYSGLEDYTIVTPKIENMRVKEIADNEHKREDGMWINTIEYQVTPLKSGHFTLEPQSAKIEFLSAEYKNFNNRYKYLQKRVVYSKKLQLDVQTLPQDVKIVGHYTLKTKVSTTALKAGEPLTYTVILEGEGNLKNLDSLNLAIRRVTFYPISASRVKNIYTKSFELLSDKSYTLPPLSLKYFDTSTNKVRTLVSQSYDIIIDAKPLKVKSAQEKKEFTLLEKTFYFGGGLLTFLFLYLSAKFYKLFHYKSTRPQSIQNLEKIKNKELFLKKVLSYLGRSTQLNKLIYQLETISPKEFKKLKKEIIAQIHKENS